eukprot:scaffold7878_cov126-Isochrysis_galbana.AAC.6
MGAAITYLLLDLEGVDTEPDILDDGKKGPWTIFATAECAEQFKSKYGEAITMTFSEIPIEFTITYGEIETKKGGPSNEQSNARALASALADSTTHLVVRINEKSIANRVNLSHFNAACKRVGLKMVKGNREKRKINTPDGLITTSGKKFVWRVERGEFVCLFVGSVGQSVRSVCCLSLALPRRVMCGQWCGSFRA